MSLQGRMADEDTALPLCDIKTADYPHGIRVWPATKPIFDSSDRKERGTYGWHVHAYDAKGGTPINQTYLKVVIDGVTIGDLEAAKVCTCSDFPTRWHAIYCGINEAT